MTVADDLREELESLLHQQGIRPRAVVEILDAADAYARAYRHRRPPKPPSPPKPPAVHWRVPSGRPACRLDGLLPARGWAVSADPAAVTCGHCRKTAAWLEASA